MHLQYPLHYCLFFPGCREPIVDPDRRDFDGTVRLADIPFYIRFQCAGFQDNVTRCQGSAKGARQSPTDRGDHVIQGGRIFLGWLNPVEISDA